MPATRFVAENLKSESAVIAELADRINELAQSAYTAAAASTGTLTAAQVVNGVYHINSGTTSALTTPTATDIVAALKNAQIGSTFDFTLINGGSGTADLIAGAGVTFTNQTDPTTGKAQQFLGRVTAVDTPAVQLIGLGGLV